MKIVALPSGKQRKICGPAVNVPTKIDQVCEVLPRLLSESELIPLKFKRKMIYKGHCMYDYVDVKKLMTALKWLKAHNPLYANVAINNKWVEEALCNDPDLVSSLIENCDVSDEQDDSMECEPSQPSKPSAECDTNVTSQDCGDSMDVDEPIWCAIC